LPQAFDKHWHAIDARSLTRRTTSAWTWTGNPECQLGDEDFIAAEVTDPEDYERLYALAEHVCINYGDYRVKAAAAGRRIPVFRLKPASAG
jgi:hypothetical protein